MYIALSRRDLLKIDEHLIKEIIEKAVSSLDKKTREYTLNLDLSVLIT